MKRVTCEMCGNPDLIKQDGVFVCQYCGCKYSVEEVQKMIVEGLVDVTGSTVKVDTSGELANLYQLARRARNSNNIKDAARYYDMILIKDPTSWEAAFYFSYFTSLDALKNSLDGVFTLVKEHVAPEAQPDVALEIVENIIQQGDNVAQYNCGTEIFRHFENNAEMEKISVYAWKAGVVTHIQKLSFRAYGDHKLISRFVDKIGELDAMFREKYYLRHKKESEKNQLKEEIRDLGVKNSKLQEMKEKATHKLPSLIAADILLICIINALRANGINLPFLYFLMSILILISVAKIVTLFVAKYVIHKNSAERTNKEAQVRKLDEEMQSLNKELSQLVKM